LSKFINIAPTNSIKASDTNLLDLIGKTDDSVVKKIKKSNYVELIQKYSGKQ